MDKDIGFIGKIVRNCLIFVNRIFLLNFFMVFIFALNFPELLELVDNGIDNSGSYLTMAIYGSSLLTYLFGILGAKFLNKFLLICYELIILLQIFEDFKSYIIAHYCCKLDKNKTTSEIQCANKSFLYTAKYGAFLQKEKDWEFIVIELFFIVMIPFLIGKINKSQNILSRN